MKLLNKIFTLVLNAVLNAIVLVLFCIIIPYTILFILSLFGIHVSLWLCQIFSVASYVGWLKK